MAEQETSEVEEDEAAPKKKSKLPLLLGIVLALAGGGGGFFAVSSGMILASEDAVKEEPVAEELAPIETVSFVEVEPILVSLGSHSSNEYLRFRAQLEVRPGSEEDVESLLPRVIDVLNGYLRAVDVSQLEKPSALVGLRAQMLRRVQVVVGPGHVNDLLIMEFVLN